jgi:hypothetical protein
LLVVKRCELTEPLTAREERDQEVDQKHADAETSTADCKPAWAHSAAADVRDLAGIEPRPTAKTHDRCSTWTLPTRNAHVR